MLAPNLCPIQNRQLCLTLQDMYMKNYKMIKSFEHLSFKIGHIFLLRLKNLTKIKNSLDLPIIKNYSKHDK